ncbi:MAG: O-methyltransferase [bacterium]|nr:O-methyltransferase [bacterium]
MEIPLEKREQVNKYIVDKYTDVPEKVLEFERRAKSLPIPPHHIKPQFGKLLQVLVQAKGAKSILEIGTMWGYSTWWLYQSLAVDGKIVTLEKELKHYNLAKDFFSEMDMSRVDLRHCDALEELKKFQPEEFDFVFIDADKREYPGFFQLSKSLLKSGGMLVVDNVIFSSGWKGNTVADAVYDGRIKKAQELNSMLAESDDFIAVPIAIESGVMIATKK